MKNYKTSIFIYCLTLFMIFVFNVDAPKTISKYISTKTDSINLKIDKPTYTIVFDANGGTGTMENMELTYGQSVLLNPNEFTKTNNVFSKWNTESDGSGTDFYNLEEISNLTSVNEAVITLYAQWENDGLAEYHVVHQKMKLDGTYELYEEVTLTGHINTTVTITPYTFTGFITPAPVQLLIKDDNSSEAIINYDRETYTLTVENYDKLDPTSTVSGDYYYETPIELVWAGVPGYIFEKWTNDETTETINFVLTEDTTIGPVFEEMVSYFVEYNGENEFMTFTKDSSGALNIKGFERNTTLTEDEVLAKTGVQVISTQEDDPDYPSNMPIYGWIENDVFYWWSETPIVNFHPDTLSAFSHYSEILAVDLTGTTTEEVKNFSHWFDTDRKLKTITGRIVTTGQEEQTTNFEFANDTNENNSSHTGMSFMFNDCNALEAIDLSGFDTSNVIDMKRMFGGTKALKSIDVSTFDTSKVRSMYWMFRSTQTLKEIDIRMFDTSNVENMLGMFVTANKVKTIFLGENFDTSNVKNFTNMFNGMGSLTTIYAYSDFVKANGAKSNNMFSSDTKLVGGEGTAFRTPFVSSQTTINYAKIANASHSGYLTYLAEPAYTIEIDYNGGNAVINPSYYSEGSPDITLSNPTKNKSTFIGWTGSNGDVPELTVTIPTGSTGNKTYVANFEDDAYQVIFNNNFDPEETYTQAIAYDATKALTPNAFTRTGYRFLHWNTASDDSGIVYYNNEEVDHLTTGESITLYAIWAGENEETFSKVFELNGSCTFHSGGNITDCPEYSDQTYIDTGIELFSPENYQKDFEIYFELSNYTPGAQSGGNGQETILNSKLEVESLGYPGFTFRRNQNNLEFTEVINGNRVVIQRSYVGLNSVRIVRKDRIIYYSFNGGDLIEFQNTKGFDQQFHVPVTIGASLDGNGNPFRFINATISNAYIKLGYDE